METNNTPVIKSSITAFWEETKLVKHTLPTVSFATKCYNYVETPIQDIYAWFVVNRPEQPKEYVIILNDKLQNISIGKVPDNCSDETQFPMVNAFMFFSKYGLIVDDDNLKVRGAKSYDLFRDKYITRYKTRSVFLVVDKITYKEIVEIANNFDQKKAVGYDD